jgi:hypothetical protein
MLPAELSNSSNRTDNTNNKCRPQGTTYTSQSSIVVISAISADTLCYRVTVFFPLFIDVLFTPRLMVSVADNEALFCKGLIWMYWRYISTYGTVRERLYEMEDGITQKSRAKIITVCRENFKSRLQL